MRQIQTYEDVLTRKNIINKDKAWDIPGGVSLRTSNLVAGNYLPEGTPISAPSSGLRYVCKQAVVEKGSTAKSFKVKQGSHHFKAGDLVTLGNTNGTAWHIASVSAPSGGIEKINLSTAIGFPGTSQSFFIYEASTAGTGAALKRTPDAILKYPIEVPKDQMVIFGADAYTRADVVEGAIGDKYLEHLKFINVVKY